MERCKVWPSWYKPDESKKVICIKDILYPEPGRYTQLPSIAVFSAGEEYYYTNDGGAITVWNSSNGHRVTIPTFAECFRYTNLEERSQ